MPRSPNLALRVVLDAMLVGACLVSLPVVRGAVQPAYEWRLFGLGGAGTGGDYAVVAALAALTWTIIVLGWRRPRSIACAIGLIAWWTGVATALAWTTATSSDPPVIRGDTLGIEVPIGWVGAGLATALLVLVLVGLAVERRCPAVPSSWSRGHLVALGIAVLLAGTAVICLRGAPLDGRASQVGVIAVLATCLALGVSIRAGSRGNHSVVSSGRGEAGRASSWAMHA